MAEDHERERRPECARTAEIEDHLRQGEPEEEDDRRDPAPVAIGESTPEPPAGQTDPARDDEHRAHGRGGPAVARDREVGREGEARDVVAHGEKGDDERREQASPIRASR